MYVVEITQHNITQTYKFDGWFDAMVFAAKKNKNEDLVYRVYYDGYL